jgi:hypothetical protein
MEVDLVFYFVSVTPQELLVALPLVQEIVPQPAVVDLNWAVQF